jgi:sugar lactone lactonase YvrE
MNARSLTFSTLAVLAVSLVPAAFAQPGTITTVVGNGYHGRLGMGGPANEAEVYAPNFVAFDKAGNYFVDDYVAGQIYKVDTSGVISVYAGSRAGGYAGDGGPAIDARFNSPIAIAVSPTTGNLFVVDSNNNVIREIDKSTKIVTTVAGNGAGAGPGDVDICSPTVPGAKATKTPICNAQSIAMDTAGNYYFPSYYAGGTQIMKVTVSTGIISVVAGTGVYGYTGDGGQAVNANLGFADGVAVDKLGNIYIADTTNCAIRKVTMPAGIITSLVGIPINAWTGTCGLAGDGGPAASALINEPWGLTVDSYGDIFFADNGNQLIRAISASGIMSTVAGSYTNGVGNGGYSGDGGPAVKATLSNPYNPALDADGNLYFADNDNFVIRKVSLASPLP